MQTSFRKRLVCEKQRSTNFEVRTWRDSRSLKTFFATEEIFKFEDQTLQSNFDQPNFGKSNKTWFQLVSLNFFLIRRVTIIILFFLFLFSFSCPLTLCRLFCGSHGDSQKTSVSRELVSRRTRRQDLIRLDEILVSASGLDFFRKLKSCLSMASL